MALHDDVRVMAMMTSLHKSSELWHDHYCRDIFITAVTSSLSSLAVNTGLILLMLPRLQLPGGATMTLLDLPEIWEFVPSVMPQRGWTATRWPLPNTGWLTQFLIGPE